MDGDDDPLLNGADAEWMVLMEKRATNLVYFFYRPHISYHRTLSVLTNQVLLHIS